MQGKKRILLTGAAGFIGFHTAQTLAARGDVVVGLDNFNSYYTPLLKRSRAQILQQHGVQVIEGDLCNTQLLKELFSQYSFTHTLHLAAQAGVRYSISNPEAYVASNLQGFVNLLEVCKHYPENPFIYASSSSVYGNNKKTPFSEKDSTDQPGNFYGATKKANELIAYSYHNIYRMPVTGLRFFTVYGPWGRPDMAYFSFADAILEDRPIKVFNHGKMKRDFTYIDDIVAGTIAALDLGAPCEVFNLGNNNPEELSHFIALLERHLGKKAIISYEPMQPGEMEATFADIEHSKKLLGFQPTTSLDIGLSRFIHWFKNYHRGLK